MNKYFISTLSVIFLLSILDILVSKTKNGKAVRAVISLIATFILITPILSIFKVNSGENLLLSDELYLNYLENLEDETVRRKLKIALNIGDFEYLDLFVEFENDGRNKNLKKVTIILPKGVILGSDEHINMIEKAKTLLEKEIDVLKVKIEIETD